MAQNKVSVNLSSADFTLSYSFKGRSVVVPGQDQNFFGSTGSWGGDTPQKGVNIPQVYYAENVVPTAEGYRSVAYRYAIDPVPDSEFVRILTLFDGQTNSALIGITADRKIYMLSESTLAKWQELELPEGYSWDTASLVTVTTIVGFAALCIQGVGLFGVDISGVELVPADLIGLDDTEIHGVCASNSILIVWDASRVYWSSTLNPLDFTPSLITGAGSGIPEGLRGSIVLCKEIKGGFIVYSNVTIIGAQYTQNNAIPWIFDPLEGSCGVAKAELVAYDINMAMHFAWTSAGLMSIQVNRSELLFPQITDFMAAGLTDETLSYTSYPQTAFSPQSKEVRIAAIASRYLCISFGYLEVDPPENHFPIPYMVQSFLYDNQLKRWGKLNVDHIQILEAPFAATVPVFF